VVFDYNANRYSTILMKYGYMKLPYCGRLTLINQAR